MSKYTMGELAKLCGITVRTVQYYDTGGILIPTELSEESCGIRLRSVLTALARGRLGECENVGHV